MPGHVHHALYHICLKLPQGQASTVVADEQQGVDLEWTVGGAFEVDTTQVG